MTVLESHNGKVLLVDLGNTSLKWTWLGEEGSGSTRAVAYAESGVTQAADRQWSGLEKPAEMYISSVAVADVEAGLRNWVERQWELEPVFVRAAASALGVVSAYERPGQLGVDRWLALIAVHNQVPERDCLVVDCGTAITIDEITGEGEHLGGIILPGFGLMQDALRTQTAIPWPEMTGEAPSLPATSTGDAIAGGGVHAVAALVEKMARQMEVRSGEAPTLVLAGSDAGYLQRLLPAAELNPDLVMQGLALLARAGLEQA
jgi:type III pantothenate kinase